MARRFFEPESLVWTPFGYIGELVMMSLLWGLCAIPLLTLGPATAALYDCAVHCLRRREGDLFARFFRTFRAGLKIGILSTLLWMLLLALPFALHLYAVGSLDSGFFKVLEGLALLLLFFLAAILCWVFPTLSRFTFGFASLNRTALRLALGNILRSVALLLLNLAAVLLVLLLAAPVLFAPGLAALLSSFLIEPVFRRYEA